MHRTESTSDLDRQLNGVKASIVHQAFTDTTTWDEIIHVLEEEALRKCARHDD